MDLGRREAPEADVLTAAELQRECDALLRAVVSEGGDRAKLEAHAPGGAENPARGARGWLRYYQQLHRAHAVLVGHGAAESGGRHVGARVADVIAAAGAEEPERVTLSDGTVVHVYPKSYHALRWLDALDVELQIAGQQVGAARQRGGVRDPAVIASGALLSSLGVRLWAWILTHPEPGLPFGEDDTNPAPPGWTEQLAPADLLMLLGAHTAVNRERLALIGQLFPTDGPSGTRLPLSGLLGVYANEHDLPMRTVLRHTSLGAVFAQTTVAAQAAREATERAKRERAD